MKTKKHTTDEQIEYFPVALTVWPEPHSPLPWTVDAVLWLPDGEPRFGRRTIEARLRADPEVLPRPTGGAIEFTMAQGHAFEQGEGLWHGRKLRYLRVWRRTLTQGWCVAREVWDADDALVTRAAASPAMQHAA